MTAAGSKHVLITGVSAGIGANIAQFFLRQGWTVYGLSRRTPAFQDTRFIWQQCDLTDPAAIAAWAAGDVAFDAIVHNAALSGALGPGLGIPMAAWREAFEVNFFAPLDLTQRLIGHCRPNACIIFLSGGGSVTPKPFVGPYAVSKLAVTKLAEQLALEYPEFRFYGLAPGAHNTKLFDEQNSMSSGALPRFAEFADVERLLDTFLADTTGRLRGRLVHVRDDIEKMLAAPEAGMIRRLEQR